MYYFLWYALPPTITFYCICRLFFDKVRSNTLTLYVCFLFPAVWLFCTCLGLLLNFFYEPKSYWDSLGNDLDLSMSVNFLSTLDVTETHNNFWKVFLYPYVVFINVYWQSIKLTFTHFSIGLGISWAAGITTLLLWIDVALKARTVRDPSQGF